MLRNGSDYDRNVSWYKYKSVLRTGVLLQRSLQLTLKLKLIFMPLCSRHTCNFLTDVSSHATVRLYTTVTQNSSTVEPFYFSSPLADPHTNKSHSFRVCKSVHHHTFNWINQADAANSQVYYLSFTYSSTCFGHPHAHHQELQQLQ